MKVYVAGGAGFCFGVKRAMKMAYEFAGKERQGRLYSLREIIHNPREVKKLEEAGAKSVESTDGIRGKNAAAIISTHGISPQEEANVRERCGEILDTTCPYVKKIHKIAGELAKQGYRVIIAGDREHYEVKGIMGYACGSCEVVSSEAEAGRAALSKKTGIVAQTTQNAGDYLKICGVLTKRVFETTGGEVRVFNTICDATMKRQEAALELAKKVDVMIVAGGKNSANTRRLYALCRKRLKRVYHVEEPGELKRSWFKGVKKAGLTAGASTPESLINEIREKIIEIGEGNGK